jgi:hypothetical protein
MAETSLSSGSTSSESIARTAAYLSSWRQAILDDPKALMTAFAEAEKAADWVMQRHPMQLQAAAKLAAEGQGMSLTNGSDMGVIQTRDTAHPAAQFSLMVQPMIERPGLQMG